MWRALCGAGVKCERTQVREMRNGSGPMSLADRLSMVVTYVVFAFVGAIIVGMI
ncbi:hypothetical protein [Bradyrhizobium sp. SZCCHNRI1001]|uniref:hypothetical protein n=1 Tax=Bradyrhizobium sp. SZCCHNRI1001 TaxID=3057273 RepID=UPI0028E4F2F8|nr:hypothetical protein [Bradyrhizobium sp. SZCCHNRI1001]